MNIRNFADADLAAIVAIYNATRARIECFKTADVSVDGFRSLIEDEEIQVAEDHDNVTGFVSVWAPEKFIHHLYVSPQWQNKGVGKALIRACVARYGLPLALKSMVANTQACAFYEHNRWRVRETGIGSDGSYHYYHLDYHLKKS